MCAVVKRGTVVAARHDAHDRDGEGQQARHPEPRADALAELRLVLELRPDASHARTSVRLRPARAEARVAVVVVAIGRARGEGHVLAVGMAGFRLCLPDEWRGELV